MNSNKLIVLGQKNFLEIVLFLILFTYVILRAYFVFYIHDELATKYGYMIDWNPFPFTGYIDANNHFLNSLLGGLFFRVFQSDHLLIIRLSSILAFPIFFWSLVGFKRYFKSNFTYFLFLTLLSCNQFIVEYFSLSRGYAMAWAFMLFAILMTFHYQCRREKKHFYWALLAWIISYSANLSLIPMALIGCGFLFFVALRAKQYDHLKWGSLALLPFGFAVYYSFHLKSLGKLYLGSAENFIDTSIAPMLKLAYELTAADSTIISIGAILFGVMVALSFSSRIKHFQPGNIFYLFFLAFIALLFSQNWLIGVNFPEDRAAMPLLLLSLASIPFMLDNFKSKYFVILLLSANLLAFFAKVNLSHSETWSYEHFDHELSTKIPLKTNGTPSSAGGRFWQIDNELSRTFNYPARIFQNAILEKDTLMDYIIQMEELRPNIKNTYHIIHKDSISNLCLFERNTFLKRTKTVEKETKINGAERFYNFMPKIPAYPAFIRCQGTIENITIQDNYLIIFTAEDSITGEKFEYGGINPISTCHQNENGSISFDFTYTMNQYPSSAKITCYLYNNQLHQIKGTIRTEVYKIEF